MGVDQTNTARPPYSKDGGKTCAMQQTRCWHKSFCSIYGCAKHPENLKERQSMAEDEDRRLGYTP